MTNYTCPACYQEFEKAKKSHCPLCDTLLVSKRAFIDGKLKFWYELPVAQIEVVKTISDSTNPVNIPNSNVLAPQTSIASPKDFVEVKLEGKRYPFRLTEPGQLPVVIQSGDNEFDVYFQHMMYTGMVYCPKCQSPAFQNMQLFGDLEHLCDQRAEKEKCGAKTVYHFNDPNDVDPN